MPDEAASMEDVAARAGVSVSTVSRALRNSGLVSAATRARVLAAAEELSFSVSRAASTLATGKVGRIAVLVSGHLGSWFNGSILDGIYAHLRDHGLELLIYRIIDTAERRRFFATLPARRNADALIVASFALTSAEQERLQALSMPLVYLNQHVAGAASVFIDDVAGARMGARHLLNLGHRRLAFVKINNRTGFFYSASKRIDGFHDELTKGGVPADEQLTVLAGSSSDGEQVVARFLELSPMPTALMVESDELAMSIMAALSRTGIKVPEDVSVLGFDDHVMAGTFGLSTIAQPVGVLGRQAAALAVALTADAMPANKDRVWENAGNQIPVATEIPMAAEITVATELILRHTTSRPRSTDQPVG